MADEWYHDRSSSKTKYVRVSTSPTEDLDNLQEDSEQFGSTMPKNIQKEEEEVEEEEEDNDTTQLLSHNSTDSDAAGQDLLNSMTTEHMKTIKSILQKQKENELLLRISKGNESEEED